MFVSDIQPGSCSDEAGLHRGDMILCVNGEDFVGINYDTAASILKNSAGLIKLIVANPNPVPVKGGTLSSLSYLKSDPTRQPSIKYVPSCNSYTSRLSCSL